MYSFCAGSCVPDRQKPHKVMNLGHVATSTAAIPGYWTDSGRSA
jgi:hypothetical protein